MNIMDVSTSDEYKRLSSITENDLLFLIVTVTELETEEVLCEMKPLSENSEVEILYKDSQTYNIGRLGTYNVVHVRCGEMGSTGRDSVINTIRDATVHWEIDAIIMIGIAFGIDSKKQCIGDVLISSSVTNYEHSKITPKTEQHRSVNTPSGKMLFNRFQNKHDWNFPTNNNRTAKKHCGLIISGEKLVDNEEFLSNLRSKYPSAIGGDMEGFGVYSASLAAGINEWIVVKGICDWADGNKSIEKHEKQKIAIKSAVSLCKAVFSEKAFEDLKSEKLSKIMLKIPTSNAFPIVNEVDEDIYTKPPLIIDNGSERKKC